MTPTLPADLDRDLVRFYRAWDRLERRSSLGSVIDFDLADADDVPVLENRDQVFAELTRLHTLVRDGVGPALDLVRARLTASLTYLGALRGDARLPLRDYVLNTMGVEPDLVPEARIRQSEARLTALLRDKVGESPGIPFSRKGFDPFRRAFQTGACENLKRQFEYFCEKWLPRLCGHIDAAFEASSIAVEFAEEDAYWKNWISGNIAEGQPITLRINVHERHVWYQGAVEILVLHEYCGHAVQMALWQRAVRQRQIASFFGILTVHFPDQFLLEGLAESVAYFLPDERRKLEKRSEVVRELHAYNLMVLNNVHILANDRGLDAARSYAKERLPFTTDDAIERELRDRTSHPLFRTYQYIYGPAKDAFVTALTRLTGAKAQVLLRELYRTPMTPVQVGETFARFR
jgi:hypothetical protein